MGILKEGGTINNQAATSEKLVGKTDYYVAAPGVTDPVVIDMRGFGSFSMQFTGGGGANSFQVQGSNNQLDWAIIQVEFIGVGESLVPATFIPSNSATDIFVANKTTDFVRLSRIVSHASNVSDVIITRHEAPITQAKNRPFYSNGRSWSYITQAAGISATTTIRTAQSPAFRNIITSIEIDNSGSGGTEVSILDGAGGAALWRRWLPPTSKIEKVFNPPLVGSPGTLMQLALSSTTNVTLFCFAQGYQTTA